MLKPVVVAAGLLWTLLNVASFALAEPGPARLLEPVELAQGHTISGPPIAPDVSPIATSRPSFTDTATTVPRGSLQVENGATYTDSRGGGRSWTVPETMIRLGLTNNTEFRFLPPDYIHLHQAGQGQLASNFGDMAIGLSHHRALPGKIDLALIPVLNLPTGANNVSANAVDPQFRLAASRKLTPKFTLGSQFDVHWHARRDAPAAVTFTPTVITSYRFTKRLSGFVEYAGVIPTEGRTVQFIQSGLLCALSPRQQVDVRLATGLNGNSPNILVGFGYSFRLDHLPGLSGRSN